VERSREKFCSTLRMSNRGRAAKGEAMIERVKDDNVAYLLNEPQALLLCMLADEKEALRAGDIRAEMVEIIRAWHRGYLMPKHEAPLLCGLLRDLR
jgi:hypothetical protein